MSFLHREGRIFAKFQVSPASSCVGTDCSCAGLAGRTGVRAVLASIADKQARFSRWARQLQERRGYWCAVVAIAAKNARLAWAVLRHGEDFRLISTAA